MTSRPGRGISGQIVINSVAVGAVKVKGLIFVIVLTQVLGVTAYGVWVQLFALSSLLAVIVGLGLVDGMARVLPEVETADRGRLIWTCLVLGSFTSVAAACAVVLLAPLLADGFAHNSSYTGVFRVGALLIPAWTVRNLLSYISRARNRIRVFSALSLAGEALEIGAVVSAGVSVRSLQAVVAACVLARVVSLVMAFVVNRDLVTPGALMHVRRLVGFSLPLVPSQVGDETLARSDRLIVGAFMGATAAGVYSAIYSVAALADVGTIAAMNVLFPRSVRARETHRRLLSQGAALYGVVAALGLTAVTLAARPITTILVHSHRAYGDPRVVLALCSAGALFLAVGRILSVGLLVRDRTTFTMKISLSAALVNVVADVTLVPIVGLAGAAAATAIAYGLYLGLHVVLFRRGGEETALHSRLVEAST